MARVKKLSAVAKTVADTYLSDEEMDLRKLGEIFDCSPGTARSCLIEQGVKLRSRGRRKIKKEDATPTAPPVPEGFESPIKE